MIYWMCFFVATIPLLFGFASIKWGNAAFGFGLWISSGWFILSRLQSFTGGQKPPWTLNMAQRLQIVMDEIESESKCCNEPIPEWQVMAIKCKSCAKILDEMPRPDLGRKRQDGFFLGGFRLLLTDGYPVIAADLNGSELIDDSEE
tara:strand:+ start:1723 stop:2160 length:438 start_codon:yes stop_codon:yes gene_type:complete